MDQHSSISSPLIRRYLIRSEDGSFDLNLKQHFLSSKRILDDIRDCLNSKSLHNEMLLLDRAWKF